MHSKIGPMWQNQPLRLCTASVHNTTQNSSDNLPFYQTSIIARMLSIGGETKTRVKNKQEQRNEHSSRHHYTKQQKPKLFIKPSKFEADPIQ